MSPIQNSALIFKSNPTGPLVPGEHLVFKPDSTIDIDSVALDGGVLSKAIYLGVDVWIRARMMFEYVADKPIFCYGVGVVLRSEDPNIPVGSHVTTKNYPFEEYTLFPKVLGLAGQTAWVGWKARAQARKGETVYVTAAAGTVGSMICQIAKYEGLKVIGSAGSDEKVRYLREELGVDYAFNYKKDDLGTTLKEHGPIDIFWDTVGGQALDTTLEHMNMFGRVIIAGFISVFGGGEPYRLKNSRFILMKTLTVAGFNIDHLIAREGNYDLYLSVTKLVKEGHLYVKEQISTKLSDVPQLLIDNLKGDHFGKPIIQLGTE